VSFAGGTRRRFDLVVGTDGLHSGMRGLLFGPDAGTPRHLGAYLAFYSVPNHLNLDRRMVAYGEPGRGVGLRSIRDNRAAMAYFGFRSEPLDYDHRDLDAQRRILRDRITGMAWETSRLLAHLDDAPDFYFDSCSQVELDRWSDGRVALLGDAAFCSSPLSGQGTSLALVAAYVLAGELAAHPGDHAQAFAVYERRLRPFVEANQEMGRQNAKMSNPASRVALMLQYAMLFGMTHMPGASYIMRRMMKGINEIDLPEYPLPA
jgi:2-polyprenyl-6-methoxyphenol hydroxylase-like FAD-dependent oxidoreductase